MDKVHKLLNGLKDHFGANGVTNRVLFGDASNVDADKTTIMPVANIDLVSVSINGKLYNFLVRIHCLGWVKDLKTVDPKNDFYGANNKMDVLNEQLYVLSDLIKSLTDGDLYDDLIRLNGNPFILSVMDFGGSSLSGWTADLNIHMLNDTSAC